MTRGRPGRKPGTRLRKSFLIEKGVKGAQLKKELTLGGRINIEDLDGGVWLKPTVILRRLTVTIGGFKIELLPGPSYSETDETSQSAAPPDGGLSSGGDVGTAILPDDAVKVENPAPENVTEMDVNEKSSTDDAAIGLGPYVNPNDVQTSNGTLKTSPSTQETKLDNQSISGKEQPAGKEKVSIKQPESNENNTATVRNKTDVKEMQQSAAKALPKQGLASNKNKDLVSCKTSNIIKEHKMSQNIPSKIIQKGDLQKKKPIKEKQDVTPLKRPADTQSEHAAKVQKIQGTGDIKVKPKLPSTPEAKKIPPSANRGGDQQAQDKHTSPHNSSRVETAHPAHAHPLNCLKTLEEMGQDKLKAKKVEKILQKQKSKNARSVSVDEPQLFIPDNAPVVKKETAEEQPANSEPTWDGNNCCGLCKKHHNNM